VLSSFAESLGPSLPSIYTQSYQPCQLQTPRLFFSPTPSMARCDTRTHTTKGVGGWSSLGPADAVGTVRLMPFLPDDAPSPPPELRLFPTPRLFFEEMRVFVPLEPYPELASSVVPFKAQVPHHLEAPGLAYKQPPTPMPRPAFLAPPCCLCAC
jgi:hypothetical protein